MDSIEPDIVSIPKSTPSGPSHSIKNGFDWLATLRRSIQCYRSEPQCSIVNWHRHHCATRSAMAEDSQTHVIWGCCRASRWWKGICWESRFGRVSVNSVKIRPNALSICGGLREVHGKRLYQEENRKGYTAMCRIKHFSSLYMVLGILRTPGAVFNIKGLSTRCLVIG